jgi:hypothetical protein
MHNSENSFNSTCIETIPRMTLWDSLSKIRQQFMKCGMMSPCVVETNARWARGAQKQWQGIILQDEHEHVDMAQFSGGWPSAAFLPSRQ